MSKHFNVREFDCHDGRHVPASAQNALERLCVQVLEPMRAKFGPCQVLSGYRPEDYNRAIGGAKYSQHIYELTPDSVAADVRFVKGSPKEWARFARKIMGKQGGVGRYDISNFCHVDNRRPRADWKGN